jgi:hypothetical protein
VLTPPTHSNIGKDVDGTRDDGIHGMEYNNDDEDFNYHSSDGSAKKKAAAHRDLGNNVVGWLPMATTGNKEGATHNFVQMDDTPNWLHEIVNNQTFGKADPISTLINQFFPCIKCNDHKNINDPFAWFPVLLWKSGIVTWELFDVNFR